MGRFRLRRASVVPALWLISLAVAAGSCGGAHAAALCPQGWFADAMLGAYHVHPYKHFDDVDPGVGLECSFTSQWAATSGYFRNSLERPSFYGGAIYTPEFAHWQWFRLGLMGGIISGYNYGKFGIGPSNSSVGPLLAPAAFARVGRFGMNFILIPPIPADNLPFTVGFQAKYRIR
jgi:hypothetical protein